MLFFFTDGVTEARSPELTYFEDRLTDELMIVVRPSGRTSTGPG